jgi:hypothetical protein
VTAVYEQGNTAGYSVNYDSLKVNYLDFGFVQGPTSTANWGLAAVGPTGAGQHLTNCQIHAAYPIILSDFQQGGIDRCDTYTAEFSPYDGTEVGSGTAIALLYTVNEQTGGTASQTSQLTIKDWNSEPAATGSRIEIPAYADIQCSACEFLQDNFEGGFSIFGGSNIKISNSQISSPAINYGFDNDFENVGSISTGWFTNNWADGANQFFNWGTRSKCSMYPGNGGPATVCGVGFVQSYNGHSVTASSQGMGLNPFENIEGGAVVPGEWNTNGSLDAAPMQVGYAVDSHEPTWGSYAGCNLGGAAQCRIAAFDGFNGFIYIGQHNRIYPGPTTLEANFKNANLSGSFTLYVAAFDSGSGQCGGQAGIITTVTIPVTTSWSHHSIPVDFTGKQSCVLTTQFYAGTVTDQLRVGEFTFIPVAQRVLVPVVTPTEGASCPLAGSFIGMDANYIYVCSSGTPGAGTVKRAPIS